MSVSGRRCHHCGDIFRKCFNCGEIYCSCEESAGEGFCPSCDSFDIGNADPIEDASWDEEYFDTGSAEFVEDTRLDEEYLDKEDDDDSVEDMPWDKEYS
jgi:hypothetical protein